MRKIIHLEPAEHARLKAEAEQAAEANFAAISRDTPWLRQSLKSELRRLVVVNASFRSKYRRFRDLADRIAAALAPHAACRPGCAHCCHIAVTIGRPEAEIIGEALGLPLRPHVGQLLPDKQETLDAWTGKPCPFLRDNACAIYAHRPLACRLHFSLGASPFFCDTAIPSDDSVVPNMDLQLFWLSFSQPQVGSPFGDIREFFGEAGIPAGEKDRSQE